MNILIFIFSGISILILISLFILWYYYKKTIRKKERAIVYHIHEEEKLKKELEYLNIEKKVMEKMVREEFEGVALLHRKQKRIRN
ncbi:MAG: hypothetical protein FWC10_04185 [Lentimicrobiaceae bacterium]|nr:hypothetical protein [Lentimicrobiaceae bacterium]